MHNLVESIGNKLLFPLFILLAIDKALCLSDLGNKLNDYLCFFWEVDAVNWEAYFIG